MQENKPGISLLNEEFLSALNEGKEVELKVLLDAFVKSIRSAEKALDDLTARVKALEDKPPAQSRWTSS